MVTVAVVTATGAVAALQVRTECACARVRGVSTSVLDTTPAATDSHESSMTASPNHQDTLGEGRPADEEPGNHFMPLYHLGAAFVRALRGKLEAALFTEAVQARRRLLLSKGAFCWLSAGLRSRVSHGNTSQALSLHREERFP